MLLKGLFNLLYFFWWLPEILYNNVSVSSILKESFQIILKVVDVLWSNFTNIG